jgi:hypothetical protein
MELPEDIINWFVFDGAPRVGLVCASHLKCALLRACVPIILYSVAAMCRWLEIADVKRFRLNTHRKLLRIQFAWRVPRRQRFALTIPILVVSAVLSRVTSDCQICWSRLPLSIWGRLRVLGELRLQEVFLPLLSAFWRLCSTSFRPYRYHENV